MIVLVGLHQIRVTYLTPSRSRRVDKQIQRHLSFASKNDLKQRLVKFNPHRGLLANTPVEIVWPPQTTEDVLNLTPRKSRPNPPFSPSTLRHNNTSLPSPFDGANSDPGSDDDDDDDEEVLELKLAAIQAKLKLKKLQKRRKTEMGGGQGSEAQPSNSERRPSTISRSQQQQKVQVPHSPVAPKTEPCPPKSPSRVLLGIDKGLRGRDVSLRRPPPYRAVNTRATSPSEQPRKTYSERIAEERAKEKAKAERQKVIEKSRSTSFNFGGPVVTSFNAGGNGGAGAESSLASTASTPLPHPTPGGSRFRPPTALTPAHGYDPFVSASTAATITTTTPPTEADTDSAGFDSFSTLHLSSRLMPHPTLSRHLSSKTIYLLPTLLKTVVAPEFEPPDIEGDWVVMGIICSKSEPRDVGQNTGYRKKGAESSSKYMVMQITDLKWEIEIFLFGSGFDKFWKVSVGAIVAIMNPGIMKPRIADTGRFSLTLNDDSDTLLEIGRSRDLAFCKSVKRDGKQCHQWVDKRHTHYCSFHVEAGIKKARVGRAEVNSMSKLFSPPKKGQVRPRRFFGKGAGGGGGGSTRDDGLLHEGPISDMPQRAGGAGGKVFVAPGRSAKSLLDDDGYLGDAFHRGNREDRLQKRLAASEKERQVTRRIIESQGREGGVGADYLKLGVDRWDIKERGAKEKAEEAERVRDFFPLQSLSLSFILY